MFVWSSQDDDYLQEIGEDNKPEEGSLDVGPAHVDLHVGRLVQQDVVLGGGRQDVGEGDGGDWSWSWSWDLSFCDGARDSRDWLYLIQPWTGGLLWWVWWVWLVRDINCLQLNK